MKALLAFLCPLLLAALAARAQAQESAFRTVDQILAIVPLALKGDLQNGKKQDAALAEANRLLQQDAVGKTASLKVKAGTFAVAGGRETATATAGPIQIGSRKCEVAIQAHENKAVHSLVVGGALAKRTGGWCDLTGTITAISLRMNGKNGFRLDLEF